MTTLDVEQQTATVRVFIAAHVRLYREAMVEILARVERLEIVGASGDRAEIVAQVADLKPDVVLLDPAATESVDMIRELADPAARVRVVALASAETEPEMIAYAEAGVSGYVTREQSFADLVATIVMAARGDLMASPRTAGALLRRVTWLAAERRNGRLGDSLTARELEVAMLLDEGLSNQQIASRLHVELSTVKHHVHHILHKLGAARRSEAVAYLRRRGTFDAAHQAARTE
jgi:DNA-binding NarL/FixJ family response regulator